MYRRSIVGLNSEAQFFDSTNEESLRQREEIAEKTLNDLTNFLKKKSGGIAFFDGTNTNKKRRNWILDYITNYCKDTVHVFFIESICNNDKVIKENIRKSKMILPEYSGISQEMAFNDFEKRIKFYEDQYETIDKEEYNGKIRYVKIIDGGKELLCNRMTGFCQSISVSF